MLTSTANAAPTSQTAPDNDAALRAAVQKMAEILIASCFTAGSNYGEVWIRDFNTFVAVSCKVNDPAVIKDKRAVFFQSQQPDWDIIDGFLPRGTDTQYVQYTSPLESECNGHKNMVETDQESSLIQAVATYVQCTHDVEFLNEEIGGVTVQKRMALALQYVLDHRTAQPYGLIWGGTTFDWGDVQPESPWGVDLDSSSHRAISIYNRPLAQFIY